MTARETMPAPQCRRDQAHRAIGAVDVLLPGVPEGVAASDAAADRAPSCSLPTGVIPANAGTVLRPSGNSRPDAGKDRTNMPAEP
jgi:hypothetical protein